MYKTLNVGKKPFCTDNWVQDPTGSSDGCLAVENRQSPEIIGEDD